MIGKGGDQNIGSNVGPTHGPSGSTSEDHGGTHGIFQREKFSYYFESFYLCIFNHHRWPWKNVRSIVSRKIVYIAFLPTQG